MKLFMIMGMMCVLLMWRNFPTASAFIPTLTPRFFMDVCFSRPSPWGTFGAFFDQQVFFVFKKIAGI
jgi:hypothetical protein